MLKYRDTRMYFDDGIDLVSLRFDGIGRFMEVTTIVSYPGLHLRSAHTAL